MKKISFLSFKYNFRCLLFFLSGSSIANLNSLDLPKNIYMCETKAEKDVNDPDVLAKAEAAHEFCRMASDFTTKHGGKPWHYVIIPHTVVDRSYSFAYVLSQARLHQ